jgi:hypothetical protein
MMGYTSIENVGRKPRTNKILSNQDNTSLCQAQLLMMEVVDCSSLRISASNMEDSTHRKMSKLQEAIEAGNQVVLYNLSL